MKMDLKTKSVAFFVTVLLMAGCQGATAPSKVVSSVGPYRVVIAVTAQNSTYVNAWVYDGKNAPAVDASISIDGSALSVHSPGTNYFASLNGTWTDGSSHNYSVSTPDGKSASGTMVKPTGTVTGVTYSPLKSIAASYTVTPPSGGWPVGTYLKTSITKAGPLYYGIDNYPTGSSTVTVNGTTLANATEVSFSTCLISTAAISTYTSGSKITVAGTETSW